MSRTLWAVPVLVAALLAAQALVSQASARAQISMPGAGVSSDNPRTHAYLRVRRDPYKAAGWELLVPGAGNVYTRIHVNAVITLATTLTGAALWIHGGVTDNDTTLWTGVGLFCAGRTYGLLTATVGAALVNRALRRQLKLGVGPTSVRLTF